MDKPMKQYFTYIIEASDGSWYTGYTTDHDRRFKQHLAGKGAKYFNKSRRPVCHVIIFEMANLHDALSLEYWIKKLARPAKEQLVALAVDTGELVVRDKIFNPIAII